MNTIPVVNEAQTRIETWMPTQSSRDIDDVQMLAAVLHACVCAGASVSFVLPFPFEDAEAFWKSDVLPAVAAGNRRLLVARVSGRIVGTVQLDFATPPNQAHRAEVRKLLVHPDARRRGIARSLMLALEKEAASANRTLLTLDSVTGGRAETLYRSLGYSEAGVIPGYALNFDSSRLESTTIMYKELTELESRGTTVPNDYLWGRKRMAFGGEVKGDPREMLSEIEARRFAQDWISGWNNRDLESIMSHYANDVVLTSPVVAEVFREPTGTLRGKEAVCKYFQRGLEANPHLTFELLDIMRGLSSVVLYFRNHKGTKTGEFMELDESGKVTRVVANYT